ncbi:spermatogenesis-associated protein 20 [Obelidium mucronatum]|nr:spermatogenesis-associated protein 20 [Obelidium mucronatum]
MYMAVWPMTVLLTPDLKPFFGGTYFPPGFPDLLKFFGEKWIADGPEIIQSSEEDFQKLRKVAQSSTTSSISVETVPPFAFPSKTFFILSKTYDEKDGGFGGAPKFPQPVIMNFLLMYYHATKVSSEVFKRLEEEKVSGFELERLAAKFGVRLDGVETSDAQVRVLEGLKRRSVESSEALNMVEFTMRKIAAGGIHDHVGSGFHRYSVDRTWLVPHFEKMLYDQAQLLSIYAELTAITKDLFHEEICRDIIKYVERDLRDPRGAFYSAEDADSLATPDSKHAKEGAFAVWESQELDNHLGPDSALFKYHFGVNPGGNVLSEYDPHDELTNQNILMERRTLNETADKFDTNAFAVKLTIQNCFEKLWKVRQERPKPHRDDKIMVAWNGLMISALAKTSRVIQDESKTISNLAISAAIFIRNHMYNHETNRLTRVFGTNIQGYADDYAFLIDALIELYQTTFDETWIEWAVKLQSAMDELFWDSVDGGYFSGMEGDDGVLIRMKDEYDGAEPTASSIAVKNLLRLEAMTTNAEFRNKAVKTFSSMIGVLGQAPRAVPQMVANWIAYQRGITEVVLLGELDPDAEYMLRTSFHPLLTVVRAQKGWLVEQNELLKSIRRVFVCEDGACNAPVSSCEDVKRILGI